MSLSHNDLSGAESYNKKFQRKKQEFVDQIFHEEIISSSPSIELSGIMTKDTFLKSLEEAVYSAILTVERAMLRALPKAEVGLQTTQWNSNVRSKSLEKSLEAVYDQPYRVGLFVTALRTNLQPLLNTLHTDKFKMIWSNHYQNHRLDFDRWILGKGVWEDVGLLTNYSICPITFSKYVVHITDDTTFTITKEDIIKAVENAKWRLGGKISANVITDQFANVDEEENDGFSASFRRAQTALEAMQSATQHLSEQTKIVKSLAKTFESETSQNE